eukprot:scaffold176813_cov32-Tisochrysis_lutea.AAC.2
MPTKRHEQRSDECRVALACQSAISDPFSKSTVPSAHVESSLKAHGRRRELCSCTGSTTRVRHAGHATCIQHLDASDGGRAAAVRTVRRRVVGGTATRGPSEDLDGAAELPEFGVLHLIAASMMLGQRSFEGHLIRTIHRGNYCVRACLNAHCRKSSCRCSRARLPQHERARYRAWLRVSARTRGAAWLASAPEREPCTHRLQRAPAEATRLHRLGEEQCAMLERKHGRCASPRG